METLLSSVLEYQVAPLSSSFGVLLRVSDPYWRPSDSGPFTGPKMHQKMWEIISRLHRYIYICILTQFGQDMGPYTQE